MRSRTGIFCFVVIVGTVALVSPAQADRADEQACCLADGTCLMKEHMVCVQLGGDPQGPGTFCDGFVCDAHKWAQPPTFNADSPMPDCFWGWDDLSVYGDMEEYPIVADDWLCEDDRPVTDIHWWGSYDRWMEFEPPPFGHPMFPSMFHIGIWTDVPAGVDQEYSHPGVMLWEYVVPREEVNEHPVGCDFHPQFMDDLDTCFRYDVYLPEDLWFYQEPGPTVYWVSISAMYWEPPQEYVWGWKTRQPNWNDAAIRILWPTMPFPGAQYEYGEPIIIGEERWDMAFVLTTEGGGPEPEACCFEDGMCLDMSAPDCEANGGIPQGPGSTCAGYVTACCLQDGTCVMVDPICCDDLGGVVQAAGGVCTQLEPCCFDDGSCIDLDPLCCDDLGGWPSPTGAASCTDPYACVEPEPEACCFEDGTCLNMPELDCIESGGIPQGPGTTCAGYVTGCCLPDGSCIMVDPICCDDLNGILVDGMCTEEEACCLDDGVCIMADPICCWELGGQPQGPNTMCTEPEGCCLDDGTCLDIDPLCCDDLGGVPQGPGEHCVDMQVACCLDDGTCLMVDPLCCDDLGGVLQQDGDVCTQLEPCCFDDGSCLDLDPLCCDDLGGWPSPTGAASCFDPYACVEPEPEPYMLEFSVDIGSDTELSDPNMDGDEAFDPGDVYMWRSAPVVPPGRDGFKDDMYIFGGDPWPDPPDPATAAPVGFGSIQDYWEYFDLDGHDQLDIDIWEYQLIPSEHPLEIPIPMFESQCIYRAEFLAVSYDDDMRPGWPAWDVPVTVPSPAGAIYGTYGGYDEVVGLTLDLSFPIWPYPVVNMYGIADEVRVHRSLAPNPGGDEEDDDVDSLDAVRDYDHCPYWYFSPDHEAHLGLDPGGIYQVTGLGFPAQVIDEMIHLGIPEDTDIDAFEFAWVRDEQFGPVLALLYSVDEDDPLTPWDESGGMMPWVIYGSYLMGWSFEFVEPTILWDDIDALTIWGSSMEPCPWDLSGNGFVDPVDVGMVKMQYGCPVGTGDPACDAADLSGNGAVDPVDVGIVKQHYGPCP